MLDSTKTFFFGAATDNPTTEKKPATCPYAVGNLVYYAAPGTNRGTLYTVEGWTRDENGRVIVTISRTRSGEKEVLDTTLSRLHC